MFALYLYQLSRYTLQHCIYLSIHRNHTLNPSERILYTFVVDIVLVEAMHHSPGLVVSVVAEVVQLLALEGLLKIYRSLAIVRTMRFN
jgi:hypothetical protein